MNVLSAEPGAAVHADLSINKSLPYTIGLAILATAGFAFGIFGWHEAGKAEREARLLQYYLLELDAKFIAAGLKKPEESIAKELEK